MGIKELQTHHHLQLIRLHSAIDPRDTRQTCILLLFLLPWIVDRPPLIRTTALLRKAPRLLPS
jgi:hypothetical protein